jgi:hypothetical protein
MEQHKNKIRVTFLSILAVVSIMTVMYILATLVGRVQARPDQVPGRYQISSWAAHSGGTAMFHGYYVLDTFSGKIVDKGYTMRSSVEQPGGAEAPEW